MFRCLCGHTWRGRGEEGKSRSAQGGTRGTLFSAWSNGRATRNIRDVRAGHVMPSGATGPSPPKKKDTIQSLYHDGGLNKTRQGSCNGKRTPKMNAPGKRKKKRKTNFNDYPNGMVTLFNLLVMGNWQAWMEVIPLY